MITAEVHQRLAAIRERHHGTEWEASGTYVGTTWSGAADWSGPIDDRELIATAAPEDAQQIADDHNDIPFLLALLEERDSQLAAVRDLHSEDLFRGHLSNGCASCSGGTYPCPTIVTLDKTTGIIATGAVLDRVDVARALHRADMDSTFLGPGAQDWESVNQAYYFKRADAILALPGAREVSVSIEVSQAPDEAHDLGF